MKWLVYIHVLYICLVLMEGFSNEVSITSFGWPIWAPVVYDYPLHLSWPSCDVAANHFMMHEFFFHKIFEDAPDRSNFILA